MRNRDFNKCFPIGIYWPPPAAFMNDTQYDMLKDAHINLVLNTCGTDINSVQNNISMLKKCEARHLKGIVADKRFENLTNVTEKEIDELINDYKDYGALIGFYLKDEPEKKDWDKYSRVYQKLLARKPHCVPYINLLPIYEIDKLNSCRTDNYNTYVDYYERWVELVGEDKLKYLSYDHYPFRSGGLTEDYFLNMELIRSIGLRHNVKTHCYLQSIGITGILERPNENQMRWNVFTSLAYGMKALSWFTWWTPRSTETESFTDAVIDKYGNKTDLYEIVKNLSLYIKNLGRTLIDLNSQNVYHSGDMPKGTQDVPDNFFWQIENGNNCIISYFIGLQERKYIMVVNKSMNDYSDFTFSIDPKPAGVVEISKTSGNEINTSYNPSTGKMSAGFAPGEGRLFVLPLGY